MSEFPSGDEVEVIGILINLSEMIKHRLSIFPHEIPEWGSKGRRSIPEFLKLGSQSPIIKEGSPATPLAFVQCESEEKLKIPKRKYLHRQKMIRKREDLVEKIDELTIRRDLMSQELEKVRTHYDKLKADNLGLKAKKSELIRTELKGDTPGTKSGQNSQLNQGLHDPPLKEDLTVDTEFRTPDLNVKYVLDESSAVDVVQPLDHSMVNVRDQSRAMASEARRNRIQICRAKSRSL